ncbi:MAG: Txe/YoeB family addiction module toxin [Bacteroidetes bacterium]|jgi:toxin YoeB|nr:Txe/YoeB family addiction module toxin [Bacteroidota bacterium]
MEIVFSKKAWEDYTDWQTEDRKVLKKINDLIREIQRTPYEGTGKPEALRYELAGLWSRRITQEHRLVYKVVDDKIFILACKFHYDLL